MQFCEDVNIFINRREKFHSTNILSISFREVPVVSSADVQIRKNLSSKFCSGGELTARNWGTQTIF